MKIEDEIKGRFRNEYHKGLINLTYTNNQLNSLFYKELKAHGLTPQMYNVLRVVRGFMPKPCCIGFIKERMLDQNSDVSRIVDNLFAKGLVKRTENEHDRRLKDVEISDKGLEILAKTLTCEKSVDTFLSNLSLEEVQTFNLLLDKIREKKEA